MKTISLLLPAVAFVIAGFTLFSSDTTEPSVWSVDHSHSNVGFKVRHLGISNVRGNFKEYDATITMEGADLSTLSAIATIETTSIFTDNERRDNHLRSPDFFAAEEFPTMIFQSKEVRNVDGTRFDLVGDLTIRDVTKEVVLETEFLGTAVTRGSERAGFEARASSNRMDYGLSWDRLTETGGLMVSHNVDLIIELEMTKDD